MQLNTSCCVLDLKTVWIELTISLSTVIDFAFNGQSLLLAPF